MGNIILRADTACRVPTSGNNSGNKIRFSDYCKNPVKALIYLGFDGNFYFHSSVKRFIGFRSF